MPGRDIDQVDAVSQRYFGDNRQARADFGDEIERRKRKVVGQFGATGKSRPAR